MTLIQSVSLCAALIFVVVVTVWLLCKRRAADKAREPLPVVLVRTRPPLPPDELRKIAEAWFKENGPTLHLVEDALDHFLADAVAGVCREDVTPDQRAFAAAALDATRRFRAYLFSLADAETEGRALRRT